VVLEKKVATEWKKRNYQLRRKLCAVENSQGAYDERVKVSMAPQPAIGKQVRAGVLSSQ
jgi:hypothetical protein